MCILTILRVTAKFYGILETNFVFIESFLCKIEEDLEKENNKSI